MCFPFIFRAALDTRSTEINDEMKVAAVKALANIVKSPVKMYEPDSGTRVLIMSPEYIIPSPFDPRLIIEIPIAVAKAAMESGVAKKKIENFEQYKRELN